MRIAIVTTDVREDRRDYSNPIATFGTAPSALLQGLARIQNIEVHVLSCAHQRMRSQEKLAENTWFHSLFVPSLGWLRTGYQGCIRAVRQKLQHLKPDIVHGQGTERDCALDAVFSGVPNVLTIHGNMRVMALLAKARPFSYPWLSARLEGFTIPRSSGVICITRYTQSVVSGIARRTWLLPNAVEDEFFNLTPIPASVDRPKILCVGVICHRKNQNALILALDSLAQKFNFELRFLGSGPADDPYVIEFARLVRERSWCVHQGFASRAQVQAHLQSAHLVVLPSLEDNCPMVVLEAMAAGVPVVASNVGGVPDLIESGKNGLLCDPSDQQSIAACVEKVFTDNSTTPRMVGQAKEDAIRRFHPDVVARQHLEIYREVLRKP